MKYRRSSRHFGSRKGSAALEFAALGTLFVTLLAIAMDFSRVFYANMEVASAARAGAQYGISSSAHWTDYSGMQNAAINDAPNVSGLTATASQFCTCPDNSSTTCGSGGCSGKRTYVKVVTNATYSTMGTYLLLPNSVALSAQVSMRAK
jgi:Flp pilus assembly protein TadG